MEFGSCLTQSSSSFPAPCTQPFLGRSLVLLPLGLTSALPLTGWAAPPLGRGEAFWKLERVKWKDVMEALNVEHLGEDKQRREGQGEKWRHAGPCG